MSTPRPQSVFPKILKDKRGKVAQNTKLAIGITVAFALFMTGLSSLNMGGNKYQGQVLQNFSSFNVGNEVVDFATPTPTPDSGFEMAPGATDGSSKPKDAQPVGMDSPILPSGSGPGMTTSGDSGIVGQEFGESGTVKDSGLTITCQDSDNGSDKYSAGETRLFKGQLQDGATNFDKCENGIATSYYCSANSVASKSDSCDNGCSPDGKVCADPKANTCEDTDIADDIHVKGEIILYDGNGKPSSKTPDTCNGTYGVVDYACSNGKIVPSEYKKSCTSDQMCSEGVCIDKPALGTDLGKVNYVCADYHDSAKDYRTESAIVNVFRTSKELDDTGKPLLEDRATIKDRCYVSPTGNQYKIQYGCASFDKGYATKIYKCATSCFERSEGAVCLTGDVPKPDLELQYIGWNKNNSGKEFEAIMANIGSIKISGGTEITVGFTIDNIEKLSSLTLTGDLLKGQTISVNIATSQFNLKEGKKFTITGIADRKNIIDEQDEANNIKMSEELELKTAVPACDESKTAISSDGKVDYSTKGSIIQDGQTYSDKCTDSTHVEKFFCSKSGVSSSTVTCPTDTKCSDGQCKSTIISSCDGSKAAIEVFGSANGETEKVDFGTKGSIVLSGKTYADKCDSDTKVVKYYCAAGDVATKSLDCPTGTQCQDGQCKSGAQSASAPDPKADLEIKWVGWNTNEVGKSFKADVHNIGQNIISAGTDIVVKFRIGRIEKNVTKTLTEPMNAGSWIPVVITAPQFSLNDGQKFKVSATVDPQKAIDELNENNNSKDSDELIMQVAAYIWANDPIVIASEKKIAETITTIAEIKKQIESGAGGSMGCIQRTTEIVRQYDILISEYDSLLAHANKQQGSAEALAAGREIGINKLPAARDAKSKITTFCAENYNTSASAPDPKADLEIKWVGWNTNEVGKSFKADVHNIGQNVISAGTDIVVKFRIGRIEKNVTKTLTEPMNAGSWIPVLITAPQFSLNDGQKFKVSATVDPQKAIDELNENNNSKDSDELIMQVAVPRGTDFIPPTEQSANIWQNDATILAEKTKALDALIALINAKKKSSQSSNEIDCRTATQNEQQTWANLETALKKLAETTLKKDLKNKTTEINNYLATFGAEKQKTESYCANRFGGREASSERTPEGSGTSSGEGSGERAPEASGEGSGEVVRDEPSTPYVPAPGETGTVSQRVTELSGSIDELFSSYLGYKRSGSTDSASALECRQALDQARVTAKNLSDVNAALQKIYVEIGNEEHAKSTASFMKNIEAELLEMEKICADKASAAPQRATIIQNEMSSVTKEINSALANANESLGKAEAEALKKAQEEAAKQEAAIAAAKKAADDAKAAADAALKQSQSEAQKAAAQQEAAKKQLEYDKQRLALLQQQYEALLKKAQADSASNCATNPNSTACKKAQTQEREIIVKVVTTTAAQETATVKSTSQTTTTNAEQQKDFDLQLQRARNAQKASFRARGITPEEVKQIIETYFPNEDYKVWYARNLAKFYKYGCIDAGDFKPASYITRAETAKLIACALEGTDFDQIAEQNYPEVFNDVPQDQWYFEVIMYLFANGYSHGYVTNIPPFFREFRPSQFANRAESLALLTRSYGFTCKFPISGQFADVNSGDWFSSCVNFGFQNKVVIGYDDGNFKPANAINRAEFLKMLDRFDEILLEGFVPLGQ